MPTQQTRRRIRRGHPDQSPCRSPDPSANRFPVPEKRDRVPRTLPARLRRPRRGFGKPLFITLTVKAKYEHTYEYMNTRTSGYCYSAAHALPSPQTLLLGACSSAEHGLSDSVSAAGQRGVGAQVLPSGSLTEEG
ncbi:hypothetical protein EYF80_003007 [Liparis tanakae]|uniref:Uncharacterized protein n=1 Tax=Liparis tanakae TaxID=230148 RepID=A0A4Z2JAJ0_9TELE|nr:hypothetical protein EYF80_003007 [Liparis tanakae]